jgi:hypothetical protein
MKSGITEDVPKFKPFVLNIEINSLMDAEKLMGLFDLSVIVNTLRMGKSAQEIRKALNSSTNGHIDNGHANEWFNLLNDCLK